MATPSEPIIYRRPLTLSNSVELYWYPPLNDGGNVITSYIIECANIPNINVLPSTDSKSVVNNLITGSTYYFIIKAANINGNGNIASFEYIIPGFKPDNPTNLNFSNDLSNIYFSFNNPLSVGNSTLTYNTVTLNPVNIYGNISTTYPFSFYQSSYGSNVIDALNVKFLNSNYNYKTYLQSINAVNNSDKIYFDSFINPKLPTSGLKLWLDPYDLSTISFSNGKIIKWEDKSVNKSNATIIETFAPTYDSSNCLLNFNGSQYLTLPDNTIPSGNSSYSIFMYVGTSNISRSDQWFLHSGTPTPNLLLGGLINSNSLIQSWFGNQLTANSNISTNISYLVEFTYDYGIRKTFLNGSLVGLDNNSSRNSTTSNNLIATNSNITANLEGSVGDIIIYNRILSNTERNSVKGYLERKKYNTSLQNIGNLITWLDATDSDFIYNSNLESKIDYGNKVFTWLDRSIANNNATQSNTLVLPIRRPYIQNSLDVLEFNQSYLTIPTAKYPIDAFIVLKLANISDQNGILGISPNSNNYSSLSDVSGNKWAIDATSNSLVSSFTETSGNFLLMEWSIANNNNYIRRYGSNIANSTIGTWSLPANSNIIIGNANGFDFSKMFKGYIGEIIMFNKQLDDESRYPIEGYLAWKWGLQSYLASSHPYKTIAPYLFYKSFLPSSIGQLVLWLDASDPNTVTRSGSTVTKWADRSGTITTAITTLTWTDNQLNGLPIINVSSGKVTGIFPGSLNKTIQTTFIVTNQTATITDGMSLLTYTQSGNADNHRVLDYGFNKFRTGTYAGSWQIIDISSQFFNNYFIVTSYLSTTTVGGSINGNTPQELAAAQGFSASDFSLGTPWKGNVAEVLTYSRALTIYERQTVEGYLAWKWGLSSNLPSNHPYKTRAPYLFNKYVSSFLPSSLTNLQLWLDAKDQNTIFSDLTATTLATNGSSVARWNDKSSNGNYFYQNTAGNRPVNQLADSLPGVYFSTSGKQLVSISNNVTTGNSSRTVFALIRAGDANRMLIGTGSHGVAYPGVAFGLDLVGTTLYYPYIYNNNDIIASVSINTLTLIQIDYGSSVMGGKYSFSNRAVRSTTLNTAVSPWYLGNRPDGSGPINSYIYEFLQYNRLLSTQEIQQIEGYIAWKWNIMSILPADHPYYYVAP